MLQGKEGDTYTTLPKIDLLNYEPEKNENEEYIMPENYSGEFTYEDKEVTYYYVPKGTLLTVHHFIEGTETGVPLKDGSEAKTEYIIGNKGTSYETNSISDEEVSDYYVYSRVEGETAGIYGDNEIIVTYYYKKASNGLTINKYDEDGVTPLEGAEFIISDVNDNIAQLGEIANNGTYYFEKQGNKYISNNQSKGNTVANSYIKIDMTNAKSNAKVIVNAEISSESSYDIGFARITDNKTALAYNNSSGRFVYISGTVSARDYETTIEKGNVYYLHIGYRKDGNTDKGTDTFTINSISIEGAKVPKVYTTNSLGKIEEEIDTGEYEIREIKAPYGYITPTGVLETVSISKQNGATVNITNERKNGRVIVHHYIEGTDIPVAEDDVIEKKVFEEYTTNYVESVLDKYTLVSEPTNKVGTIQEEDTVVTYYYRRITGNLKINKVDKDTNEPLEGVDFGIYEGDYGKVTLEDSIKVGNIYNKVIADKTDESDINPELYVPNGWIGFTVIDGKYIPVNSSWYVENEDDSYEGNNWVDAYVNINLEDKLEDEYFVLTANVEMRNTTNLDGLYVWFTDGYLNGNWIELSGENNKNYEIGLQGGRNYQIQLEYNKSSSTDIEDYVAIEMKLYNAENGRINTINEVPSYTILNSLGEEENLELSVNQTELSIAQFVEKDGKYVPNNCQVYADENGTESGDWAYSYFEIDLSDKEGYYAVVVNAETSGFNGTEGLYACISENLNWTNSFIEIYEDSNASDYYQVLKGGKKYYLLVEYGKNSGEDVKDYAAINSIKLYKADVTETDIGFDKLDNEKYVSNNQGQNGTTAHSVIPIDLRDKEETVELTVNAEISSEQWNDYGRVFVTDVFNLNDYADYWYELISMSGEVEAQDYKLELEGGKMYYLHMLYEKNWSDDNTGNDAFTINSVRVETPIYDTIITNEEGIAEITLPTNDYTIVELSPKEGYEGIEPQKISLIDGDLDITIENEKIKGKAIIKHVLEGTDENISDYDGKEIEPELKKGLYGEQFETEPREDLSEKYELVGVPSESNGEFEEEPQTIIYYYRIKKYPYVVNYLLKDDDDDDSNNTILSTQKADDIAYDYGTIINSVDEVIDIYGYTLDSLSIDNLKITAHGNIINIYYKVATKDLKYTVEFYKDGEKQENDTVEESKIVEDTESDIIEVNKENINIKNKYENCVLDKIMLNDNVIEELPTSVSHNDIIRIYYVSDNTEIKTKKLTYKVEYYKDGEKQEDDTIEKNQTVDETESDIIDVDKKDINIENKYDDYLLDKIVINEKEVTELPDKVEDGDIIRIYYKKKAQEKPDEQDEPNEQPKPDEPDESNEQPKPERPRKKITRTIVNNYETINNYDNTTNNYENIINNNILPNYVIPSGDGNTYITTENTNPNVVINNGTTKSDTAQQSQQSKQESVNNQKVISKIETPNTGDAVPVVTISIILITLTSNIILFIILRKNA